MTKNPEIFIYHILESIKEIENHLEGISEKEFSRDIKTQDAVTRRIEIIGEASKNLPASFRKKHPEVEWKEVAGMRDRLIHHYFGIKMDIVWQTCRKDLPKLKKQVEEILNYFEKAKEEKPPAGAISRRTEELKGLAGFAAGYSPISRKKLDEMDRNYIKKLRKGIVK